MRNATVITELLLDCLGRKKPADLIDRLGRLTHEEWEELVKHSDLHRVSPLLYLFLKSNFPDKILPQEIKQRLHKLYIISAGANTIIFNEIPQIVGTFKKIGIPFVFLKGAHLAEVIYGDIALRPMADVDILVRKEDLKRSEDALNSIGFFAARPFAENDTDGYHHMLPLTNKNRVSVEVHWCLIKPETLFHINIEQIMQRAQSANIGADKVHVMCTEDLLLYLCIHAAYQHCFDIGLIQLCDIEKIIHGFRNEIDWETVINRANEWGVERCVFLTLKLANQLLSAELPEFVLNRMQPETFDYQVLKNACEQILIFEKDDINISPRMAQIMQSESFSEKVAAIAKSLFPTKKVLSRMYPVSSESLKVYLYYPVRFKDLLIRYGSGFLRVLKRDKAAEELSSHRMKAEGLRDWMIEGEEVKPKRF